jgi:hypothetical protein
LVVSLEEMVPSNLQDMRAKVTARRMEMQQRRMHPKDAGFSSFSGGGREGREA